MMGLSAYIYADFWKNRSILGDYVPMILSMFIAGITSQKQIFTLRYYRPTLHRQAVHKPPLG